MKNQKNNRIIIAMSGGVDSSVAAKLLSAANETMGIFLHFWKEPGAAEAENKCCSVEALMDARRVCDTIGISLYTMNFSEIFKKEIVDNFLLDYKEGRTPNPCVRCNRYVKLGLLIERAKELGYDKVASGHYAIIKEADGRFKLFRGKDDNKDQSYFLYNLTQQQLSHLLFPLGEYKKEEVRKMAEKFGLPVAAKSESQEICFIPGKSHADFLKRYLDLKPGPIKTLDGGQVGQHQGLPLYTIGQRKGIEIGGIGPFYAVRMDYETNTLYVSSDGEDPALYADNFVLKQINWISGQEPKMPLVCETVIRYRHKPVKAIIEKKCDKYLVKLDSPQRAITPGQSAVFYRGDEVLGGGVIVIK